MNLGKFKNSKEENFDNFKQEDLKQSQNNLLNSRISIHKKQEKFDNFNPEALKQFQKEAIWIKEFNIARQRRFGKFQSEQVIWLKGLKEENSS